MHLEDPLDALWVCIAAPQGSNAVLGGKDQSMARLQLHERCLSLLWQRQLLLQVGEPVLAAGAGEGWEEMRGEGKVSKGVQRTRWRVEGAASASASASA